MSEYNCWKCQDRKKYAERISLYGGYCAKLCVACANAWHEFVDPLPEWKLVTELDAKIAVAVEAQDEQKAIDLCVQRSANSAKMYEIGKRWAPEPVEEPAQKTTTA